MIVAKEAVKKSYFITESLARFGVLYSILGNRFTALIFKGEALGIEIENNVRESSFMTVCKPRVSVSQLD